MDTRFWEAGGFGLGEGVGGAGMSRSEAGGRVWVSFHWRSAERTRSLRPSQMPTV